MKPLPPLPAIVATLVWSTVLPAAAQAAPVTAVAAVAAACRGPASVYLLARERKLGRSAWGPIGDQRDSDEPPLAAALSAFYESTNCAFDLDPPRALQLAGPARVDRLAVYHFKVAFASAEQIGASRVCKGDHDQWVWVERSELLAVLKSAEATPLAKTVDGEAKSVALTASGAAALRQAVADKLIPENETCSP